MSKGASNHARPAYGTWNLSLLTINTMRTAAAESAILILQIFASFHHWQLAEDLIRRAAETLAAGSSSGTIRSAATYLSHQLLQLD